ncbi:PIG-L family deacetylase [Lentzea terrae]|uniref:PIG-L family deacetylase n=1 Tax=Lentzea terrae TaxID=2200761 RepID=UPI001300B4EF|nr:PIG-L family deacetylase [Lentzea terrae]
MADSAERCLCVVGHPDDEMLFLSPDPAQAILRDVPVTIVIVSAGEFNGGEAYAESRRRGACAAYAFAAGVANTWTRSAVTFAGKAVEVNTLDAKPTVKMIQLALPDGNNNNHLHALTNMWANPNHVAPTLIYPDSPVTQVFNYNRADLVNVLKAIMVSTQPTHVQVQDANPDPFLMGEHEDHIAVANFAAAAIDAYMAGGGTPPPTLVAHRCYNTADYAVNLSTPVMNFKRAVFDVYLPFDGFAGGQPGWTDRDYHRWDLGTTWVGVDGGGRMRAFAVRGGQVWNWRQSAAGGAWQAPVNIGGGPVAATLTVEAQANGRLAVFARSLASHDIVTSKQTSSNGPFGAWTSLGNPNGPGGAHTGAPVVGVNEDGRLEVFARNSGGGVSTVYQTAINGAYSNWVDFGGGPDVKQAQAVITCHDGRMLLAASGRNAIRTWLQNSPNAVWPGSTVRASEPVTSAPSLALNGDGRPEIFWRSTGGAVRTVYVIPGGEWSNPPTALGGNGVGPIATARAQGLIFLAGRDENGKVSATWQFAPNAGFHPWRFLNGSPVLGSPAFAVLDDVPTIFAIGVGGKIMTSTFNGTTFGAWQTLP